MSYRALVTKIMCSREKQVRESHTGEVHLHKVDNNRQNQAIHILGREILNDKTINERNGTTKRTFRIVVTWGGRGTRGSAKVFGKWFFSWVENAGIHLIVP